MISRETRLLCYNDRSHTRKGEKVKNYVKTSARSVRTPNEVWAAAKKRAIKDGVTINYALNELLKAYANGLLTLPLKSQ